MSYFVPLNVYEEDIIQDAEEHTRELQIEEALKVFQQALKCQKDGDYDEADKSYGLLFNIEVLRLSYVSIENERSSSTAKGKASTGLTKQESGLPPAAEKLKYLAHKNFGILLLDRLRQEIGLIDDEGVLINKVGDIVDQFSEALMYNDEDASFLELIYSLAMPLGYTRIGRLALESIIGSSSKVTSIAEAITNGQTVTPHEYNLANELQRLLVNIGDEYTLKGNELYELLDEYGADNWVDRRFTVPDLNWLTKDTKFKIADRLPYIVEHDDVTRLDIEIEKVDWVSVANGLNDTLAGFSTSKKKSSDDPYNQSNYPLVRVIFRLPEDKMVIDEPRVNTASSSPSLSSFSTPQNTSAIIDMNVEEVDISNGSGLKSEINDGLKDAHNESIESKDIIISEDTANRKRKSISSDNSNATGPTNRSTNRSSKRVKARSDEQTLDNVDVSEDKSFFEQLSAFLSLCNMKFDSVIPVFLDKEYPKSDQYLYDFKMILQVWDDSQAEIFLNHDKSTKSNTDGNQSIMQTLDFAALGNDNIVKAPTSQSYHQISDKCSNYIYYINDGNFHFQEVRVELIYALLSDNDMTCSLLDEFWSPIVADTVRQTLDHCEILIYSKMKHLLLATVNGDQDNSIESHLYVCEGIFELLVDYYLSAANTIDSKTAITKANQKEYENNYRSWKIKVDRWNSIFRDLATMYKDIISENFTLRHKWVAIFLEARSNSPAVNLRKFQQLKVLFEEHENIIERPLVMEFTNFTNIPRLSIESCDTQISKYRAAAVFARVFDMEVKSEPSKMDSKEGTPEDGIILESNAENEDQTDSSSYLDKLTKIELLESILLDEHAAQIPEHEAISQFLSHASMQFRLRLWSMLLDAYNDQGQSQKAFDGYLRIFESSVDEITGEKYTIKSDHQRSILVLNCLSSCLDICKMLQKLVASNESLLETLSPTKASIALGTTIKLLRILHMYILFDDAITSNNITPHSHSSWKIAANHFEDLIVNSWSLFYYFYRTCLPEKNRIPDTLNDIMSIVHDAIGSRGYCSKADGSFLDMVIRELTRLDWSESEQDMIQCLHCRYDLTLASDTFSPFDHHTSPGDIDRTAALMLSKFIMRMILSKKNLNQSILRNEVKNALDEFYQAIGDPDPAVILPVAHNFSILNNYLSSSLTPSLFKRTLDGRDTLSFASSSNDAVRVGKQGFYYILGYLQLSQFRIRKRSGPGRTEDAEDAIKFFQFDIVCDTNRFESWVGLAHAFDALAEEDLTWDAENFQANESRRAIAVNQRKSILACAMAVRIYLKDDEKRKNKLKISSPDSMSAHYQQLASGLWGLFAKLLYNASRPPMQMEAFTDIPERIFCGFEGLYKRPKAKPISIKSIFKIVNICLVLAVKSNPTEWSNYYLQAKVLYKLGSTPEGALEQIGLAIRHLPEKPNSSGTHYPIIEPHYKMVSLVIKYVSQGRLSPEKGLEYLKLNPYYDEKPDPRVSPLPDQLIGSGIDFERLAFYLFFSRCISTLVKLRTVDKRKWHHRPTYRIAKLFYERFGDAAVAREEMSGFFPLKSISKSPIHIWKPDLERPGEQFEFRCRYILFYVNLLRETGDFESLCLLAKKLRKFSAGTARHQEAWEYVCAGACQALKGFLGIPQKFTEQVINKLVFEEFNTQSQVLLTSVENAKSENDLPLLVTELDAIAEIRRLNNGFGSTAALDDTYVAVYLKIYFNYLETTHPGSAESGRGGVPHIAPVAPVTPNTLAVPAFSSRISIQSLVSPEPPIVDLTSAPESPQRPSTPPAKTSSAGAVTPQKEKVRVTKRDIIIRITPFLKAVVSKTSKHPKEKDKIKEKGKSKEKETEKEKGVVKEEENDKIDKEA